jgi:GalNAc-alpha-(1->4)-GalNAc-alpha-(1->3)-diNAcBac-PP-undecaprenol alpha-1,4-N-acetyl-D-galactosaminyltransferase
VIPNPVFVSGSGVFRRDVACGRRTVLSVGRMSREKGFDLFLRAFALCAQRHEQWDLRIVGDGPERCWLSTLAEDLHISHRTHVDGPTRSPFTALQEADLFILPSRREGFPNVLLEAMACGLPVISFDCPSGPSEIISHGQNGLLVPAGDVQGLAAAMDRLMSSDSQRRQLAVNAVEVADRYRPERIFGMWDSLLVNVTG